MTEMLDAPGMGAGVPWFLLFPLLWIGIAGRPVLSSVVSLLGSHATDNPREILAERYPRGEISADQFQQRNDELRRRGA